MVVDVPEKIGQEDQPGGQTSEPDPFIAEDATLFGQQQSDDDSEAEQGDGILLFHAQTGEDAEPEPVAGMVAFGGENREVSATHPQIGFEAVRAQKAAVREVLRCDQYRDCAEKESEAPASEFARASAARTSSASSGVIVLSRSGRFRVIVATLPSAS